MSANAVEKAKYFIENEKQFHLGFLPTEQSNPKTRTLSATFAESTASGVRMLQSVDCDVHKMAERILKSEEFKKMTSAIHKAVSSGKRVIFSGCGATGRLSILLESMWRRFFIDLREDKPDLYQKLSCYENLVFSIMTGGDYALVRSVESFEDYLEFGRQQVREMAFQPGDVLVAITEGGETSSVLGTVDEGVAQGADVFLLFNNPAELLSRHLERSRQAIENPRVTVLDLSCGPMAITGSTRMQATTSEQLIAGAALELALKKLIVAADAGIAPDEDASGYADAFGALLAELEKPEPIAAIAEYIEFEERIYRAGGLVTYHANDSLLDIFTDTTERAPTFMLPPFKKKDDNISPSPWAFIKNPLYDTPTAWEKTLCRKPRCLNWSSDDYKRMGGLEKWISNPPALDACEIIKFMIGREEDASRLAAKENAAVLLAAGRERKRKGFPQFANAFESASKKHKEWKKLFIGGDGDIDKGACVVSCRLRESPLSLMEHLAVKLVLNTISSGTMVRLGKVTGNWMSFVEVSNKKLMDRGTRIIAELCGLTYEKACIALNETLEEFSVNSKYAVKKPSPVQHTIQRMMTRKGPKMSSTQLSWQAESVPSELQPMLRILGEEYPIREGKNKKKRLSKAGAQGGTALVFHHDPGLSGFAVSLHNGEASIKYGKLSHAGRAIGTLLAGLVEDGASVEDGPAFSALGVLLDCGHNATILPGHFKKWLRRLALLGYDVAMIYTEAGYQLPGEACFGYMRGSYTVEELKELDQYAAQLGIEMIGSIQALGHLEQVLKWAMYDGLRDTDHVLMVGEEKTYELIDKMVAYWSKAFRSRRFHLGMDETYDLGRGQYLDKHGHRRGLDIYTEHLGKVAEICAKHGLRPMIWSDVLFRLASASGTFYGKDSKIPDEVKAALPKGMDLAYWDYYKSDKTQYKERIQAHRDLGSEPVMASGVWSWPNMWHNWKLTEQNAGACVDACRESGLKEIIFTMWADDGSFWEIDSSLAGVTYAAEKCFGNGTVNEAVLAKRFQAVCFSDLAVHRTASRINEPLQSCSVLWDDPMLAMYLQTVRSQNMSLKDAEKHYLEVANALESHCADVVAGNVGHARLVAQVLATKVGVAARLYEAYEAKDNHALALVRGEIPAAIKQLDKLSKSFRKLWLARCQPFGLEVLQVRFAGLKARYQELSDRLGELLDGKIASIPELDEHKKGSFLPRGGHTYRGLATGSRVF